MDWKLNRYITKGIAVWDRRHCGWNSPSPTNLPSLLLYGLNGPHFYVRAWQWRYRNRNILEMSVYWLLFIQIPRACILPLKLSLFCCILSYMAFNIPLQLHDFYLLVLELKFKLSELSSDYLLIFIHLFTKFISHLSTLTFKKYVIKLFK